MVNILSESQVKCTNSLFHFDRIYNVCKINQIWIKVPSTTTKQLLCFPNWTKGYSETQRCNTTTIDGAIIASSNFRQKMKTPIFTLFSMILRQVSFVLILHIQIFIFNIFVLILSNSCFRFVCKINNQNLLSSISSDLSASRVSPELKT